MELNYKSFGQGPALIILHGLFGSLDNWVSLAKILSADFSVYVVDQRNHGRSPHSEDFTYELLAMDLEAFMDQQGIFTAHVLGHSMGGKTAMQFANEYPDRVDKLIIVDIAPKVYAPHHEAIFQTILNLPLDAISTRKEAENFLAKGIQDVAVRQFLQKNLKRSSGEVFQWKFNLSSLYNQYDQILAEIDFLGTFEKPTIFISGANSDYVLPEDQVEIQEIFSNVEFEVIPGAGHWVHAEQAAHFLEAVNRFLLD